MKKRNKSNLDERQEQRLLRIERNGCWLAFWGLLVAMGVQTAIVSFFMTFVSCYILLMFSALVYKKRVVKLELEGDEEGAKDD